MWDWGLVRDPVFNVGSRTKSVFPNPVRDPMRDHGEEMTAKKLSARAADTRPRRERHRPLAFSVSCIVVAVLSYGMVSMYWCCWLSIASGCCSASPKEETRRNPAIGGAYGLWQAGAPCARSLATSPHGQDTEQQPDSNDSRQHQYILIIP